MIQLMIDLQPFVLGLVLAWAGGYKLAGRVAANAAAVKLLGNPARARWAFRLVGGVELAVAALLLAPPVAAAEGWLATGLAAGFVGYLGISQRVAPGSSCGCMSSHAAPVSWRSYARAGLLVAAGIAATQAGALWTRPLAEQPPAFLSLLAVETLLFVAVSPDLDRAWRMRTRQLWARLRPHPLAATATDSDEPLQAVLWRLHHTETYQAAAPLLRSSVLDSWQDGTWWFVTYAAERDGEPVTAVFAIPHLDAMSEVRLALVADPPDESNDTTPAPALAPIS